MYYIFFSSDFIIPCFLLNMSGQATSLNIGFKDKQYGCIGLLLVIISLASIIASIVLYLYIPNDTNDDYTVYIAVQASRMLFYGIFFLFIGLGQLYIEVEDDGDCLLVNYGPFRHCLCGFGKSKIRYRDIKDYEISRSCAYGVGVIFGSKLFSSCSIGLPCFFKHEIIRITVKERYVGHDVLDVNDCCLEYCCMRCCCDGNINGNAEHCGNGFICQCCNGCKANCLRYNTFYISTNKSQEFINNLRSKCEQIEFL